jgi:ArsR family transcriptional regulator
LARASGADIEQAAGLFRAAGDPSRLRLLHLLESGELCVSELAAATESKLSTLSQQLRVLLAERLVKRRRSGKHVFYSLADDHIRELIRAALHHAGETRPRPERAPPNARRRS